MDKIILEVDRIDAYYGDLKAIENISLNVKKSEIVGIIGANGAGKTTTLRAIFGIVKTRKGCIYFKDERVDKIPPYLKAKKGISFIPTGGHIFSKLSVTENLEMGAFIRKDKEKITQDIEMMFSLFPNLKDRKDALGQNLSGGERQMLAIARGIMLKPDLLLIDEPSLGLAPTLIEGIYNKLKEIRESGVTILIVEQNVNKILEIADRIYVYSIGKIFTEGKPEELKKSKDFLKAFLE